MFKISSQTATPFDSIFNLHKQKLEEKDKDEKSFKKEHADFDDGSFKPFGKYFHSFLFCIINFRIRPFLFLLSPHFLILILFKSISFFLTFGFLYFFSFFNQPFLSLTFSLLFFPCLFLIFFRIGKLEDDDEEEKEDLDFDSYYVADVDKKEKMSTYTKDMAFDTVSFIIFLFFYYFFFF